MLDIDDWMQDATNALQTEFGESLLFVGLQGSMRRGEATAASDIDIVVILEAVTVSDLKRIRGALDGLAEGHLAHGFTAGRAEIGAWPPHEIFGFVADIRGYYGDLDPLIPEFNDAAIAEGIRINSAEIYHATAHTFLAATGEQRKADLREALSGLIKSFYFALVLAEYLRTGRYVATRTELEESVTGVEKALLRLNVASASEAEIDRAYDTLLKWASRYLNELR